SGERDVVASANSPVVHLGRFDSGACDPAGIRAEPARSATLSASSQFTKPAGTSPRIASVEQSGSGATARAAVPAATGRSPSPQSALSAADSGAPFRPVVEPASRATT